MDARLDDTIDFRDFAEAANFAMVMTEIGSSAGVIVYANKSFEQLTGYDEAEILGRDCRFLQGPETDAETIEEIKANLFLGKPFKVELLNYRKNGEMFWNELYIAPRFSEDGRIVGHFGIQSDVSRRRTAEDCARETEERLNSIIDNIPGYIYQRVMKPDGTIVFPYLSPSFARFLKLADGKVDGDLRIDRFMYADEVAALEQGLRQSAASMSPFRSDCRVIAPGGEERWIRSYSKPRRVRSDIVWDVIGIDITSEKSAEARLNFLSYNDPLTGLPNRSLFAQSLQQSLASPSSEDTLVLVHIDVCGLQEINEALGRSAGDAVLRGIASRLATLAVEHGHITIARTGGDEFALFGSPRQGEEADGLALLLRDRLAEQRSGNERSLGTEVCIGFAVHAGDSEVAGSPTDAAAELSRQADVALSLAKRDGPGSCRRYNAVDDDRIRHRALLKQSLQRGIGEEQFEIHYHPFVDLASGRIVGAEALIRWAHPDLGMQRPDLFIPIAEETGLIVPLGEWIIGEVMRQAQEWRAAGLDVPRLSINVSGKQFQRKDLSDVLERALLATGSSGRDFELEITEGTLINNSPDVLTLLRRIEALGFTLSVDDFGTGYSSLIYLRDLPVTKLKIDQTFVRRMVVDSSDASIVRAILAMARSLKLDVVAEGIETTMQRDFLCAEGCRIGQGYLFSLPLVAEDFGWLLEQNASLPLRRMVNPSVPDDPPPDPVNP